MDYKIKIIIIGEAAVGKTSLVKAFTSRQFIEDYRPSIGTNLFTTEIALDSGKIVKIQIWDIAGQERWTEMRHVYYKGTQGILIVADLTRKVTFQQIENFWYPELKQNNINSPLILLANKDDLKWQVTDEEVESLGRKIDTKQILYTSAKTGEHVIKAFKIISEEAIKSK